jgi:hypothetical protein
MEVSHRLISIGDFIEVRNKAAFIDTFIIVCNVIFQCKLVYIKRVWFDSIMSLLAPFVYDKNIINQFSYFRFPR